MCEDGQIWSRAFATVALRRHLWLSPRALTIRARYTIRAEEFLHLIDDARRGRTVLPAPLQLWHVFAPKLAMVAAILTAAAGRAMGHARSNRRDRQHRSRRRSPPAERLRPSRHHFQVTHRGGEYGLCVREVWPERSGRTHGTGCVDRVCRVGRTGLTGGAPVGSVVLGPREYSG